MHKKRPKHLNLIEIKLPLPALISILHRVSGVLLFFPGIPILLYSLQMMLGSPQSYIEFHVCINTFIVKCALVIFLWFFMHHLCAGIRHLALDLHYGIELEQARMSSRIVFVVGIVLTVLIGAMIW